MSFNDELDQLPVAQQTNILTAITDAASNPLVDPDKLERLYEIRNRELARESLLAFNAALHKAQGEMVRIAPDKDNSQTKSKYATFAALDRAIRPIYYGNGFSVTFSTEPCSDQTAIKIVALLSHVGGHTQRYEIDMPTDGKGMQGAAVMTRTHATGSAFTYGKRYLLGGMFNIAIGEADDDGNAASTRISEEEDAVLEDYYQAIGEADTVKGLVENVGKSIATSALGGAAKKKVRATYTARLNKLREQEKH